jgi:hypothetical protein
VGPLIGGLLSRPAVKYPDVFPPGSLFERFPYLLPPLVSCSVTLLGLLTGFFFLTESRKPHQFEVTACRSFSLFIILKRLVGSLSGIIVVVQLCRSSTSSCLLFHC